MANIKSQQKRNRSNERRRQHNKTVRSELRTRTKAAERAIAEGSEDADELVRAAQKRLAKAGRKGVIHPRAAARRQSRIMKRSSSASS